MVSETNKKRQEDPGLVVRGKKRKRKKHDEKEALPPRKLFAPRFFFFGAVNSTATAHDPTLFPSKLCGIVHDISDRAPTERAQRVAIGPRRGRRWTEKKRGKEEENLASFCQEKKRKFVFDLFRTPPVLRLNRRKISPTNLLDSRAGNDGTTAGRSDLLHGELNETMGGKKKEKRG